MPAIEQRAAGSVSEIALDAGVPAKRIQLFRIGANPTRDGRKAYRVDDLAHAEAIIAASNAYHGSTEPMIDYDHQSVFGAKDGVGGRAAAAGWVKGLSADATGIYADVEWTDAASAALAAKEYRYSSPYFGFDPSGRVTRIFNAALTNRPDLELQAVASQSPGDSMDEIIKALGLAEGASLEQVLDAITMLMTDAASAKAASAERAAICSALGLKAGATAAELRAAASAGGLDASKFVPMSEFVALREKLSVIVEDRATASVDAAIAAGKLTPANRDWGLKAFRNDEDAFNTFIGNQPEIVGEGPEERRAASVSETSLSASEKTVADMLGLPHDDFLKTRKGDAR